MLGLYQHQTVLLLYRRQKLQQRMTNLRCIRDREMSEGLCRLDRMIKERLSFPEGVGM